MFGGMTPGKEKIQVFYEILVFFRLYWFIFLFDNFEFHHNLLFQVVFFCSFHWLFQSRLAHFYFFLSKLNIHIECPYLYLFKSSYADIFFSIKCDSILIFFYPTLTLITPYPFGIIFFVFIIRINLLTKLAKRIIEIVVVTVFAQKSVSLSFYLWSYFFMNLLRVT